MKTTPSPLKWHGGKGAFNGKLAKWIVSLMPPHLHRVHTHAGGLSELFYSNPEGVSEVVNDINGRLTNFWRALANPRQFYAMTQRLSVTPFSEAEWEASRDRLSDGTRDAIRFFVRCRQSLAGRMKGFTPLSRTRTRRGMNEQVSAWLTAIEGLPEVHARLMRVAILTGDALDVIRQEDGKDTLFYLDPPYLQETRTTKRVYEHEMTPGRHLQLLKCLATIKGHFLLSGYRSHMYDSFAMQQAWHRREFSIVNNASNKKKKDTKTEYVWMNYKPTKGIE